MSLRTPACYEAEPRPRVRASAPTDALRLRPEIAVAQPAPLQPLRRASAPARRSAPSPRIDTIDALFDRASRDRMRAKAQSAAERAKELKDNVKDKLVQKRGAMEAASTKIDRYDYRVYSSKPLKDVVVKGVPKDIEIDGTRLHPAVQYGTDLDDGAAVDKFFGGLFVVSKSVSYEGSKAVGFTPAKGPDNNWGKFLKSIPEPTKPVDAMAKKEPQSRLFEQVQRQSPSLGPMSMGRTMHGTLKELVESDRGIGLTIKSILDVNWLRTIEANLAVSPLHLHFQTLVTSNPDAPFIVPLAASVDATTHPISGLMVVPLTRKHLAAFKRTGGEVDVSHKRLVPWEVIGNKHRLVDVQQDARKRAAIEFEMERASGNNNVPEYEHADASWAIPDDEFLKGVAVFSLGIAQCADTEACTKNFDSNTGDDFGNVLTIGVHPLVFLNPADRNPSNVLMSIDGAKAPLVNALPHALEGEHIDLPFLFSAMQLVNALHNTATQTNALDMHNKAVFRKLLNFPRNLWQNPGKTSASALVERPDADREFGQTMEELGLVDAHGKALPIEQVSLEQFDKAVSTFCYD